MCIRKFIILTALFSVFCLFSCQNKQQEFQNKQQKIWLHHANDIEKARYFRDKYAGLEIDLTYIDSSQSFLVFHGGDVVEPNPVTLEQWLSEIKEPENLNLWLDFKNLDKENKASSLNELKRLCAKYGMKPSNLIVESRAASCLPAFQDAGYQVSFYIPTFNPDKTSSSEIQKYTNQIRKATRENDINTISGNQNQYQFMRDSFPDKNVLFWYSWHDGRVRQKYIEIANNDEKVKVLLVADEE